jgi:phosphoglycolate phosphatase
MQVGQAAQRRKVFLGVFARPRRLCVTKILPAFGGYNGRRLVLTKRIDMFDLVVFDWDGTLMDSAASIVAAIKAASREMGLPEPSDERARHVIGLGLSEALAYAVPELAPWRYREMAEQYRRHYLANDQQITLFAGVREMLFELQAAGVPLAVATGKSRLGLDRALASTGLGSLFVSTRTADQCRSKPDPQMLLELMTECGAAPDKTLMIGDTTHDLQMAGNAGAKALAVSYGAHSAAELKKLSPLACFERVAQLHDWLRARFPQ